MGFEQAIKDILRQPHVEGVIFLDSEGESIFSLGKANSGDLKAMGAYQGIILNSIERLKLGENESVLIHCDRGSILTQRLKLGYFVSVLLSADANLAHARFQFQDYFIAITNDL